MKVVATRSFFGSGISVKKGVVIEVSDKLGKAWLKAGLVSKTDDKAEATVATTSPKKAPKSPKKDDTETTGEVVDDEQNDVEDDQTDVEADKEPTTTGDDKTGTEPTEPTEPQAPTAPVAPVTEPTEPQTPTAPVAPQNSNQNTKKGSK